MRCLALLVAVGACIASFAGEAPPDIPDPFGLGERLALIDHLRDAMKVQVPDDASYEQLVALYWASQRGRAPTAEEALTRDRVQRLRGRLADEFGIISLPTMILVDPSGKVVDRDVRSATEVEGLLDEAVAKKE